MCFAVAFLQITVIMFFVGVLGNMICFGDVLLLLTKYMYLCDFVNFDVYA